MLCMTVVHNNTRSLIFVCVHLGWAFYVFIYFSLDYFVLVLLDFVVLCSVSSLLGKRSAGKNVSEMTYSVSSGNC